MNNGERDIFCDRCGSKLASLSAEFCDNCGSKLLVSPPRVSQKKVGVAKQTNEHILTDLAPQAIEKSKSASSRESSPVTESIKFCPECGKKLTFGKIKFCPYCGTKMPMIV